MGGHVARMIVIVKHTILWSGNLKGGEYSVDVGIDGRIILECI